MSKNYKTATRTFYKAVKATRTITENHDPTELTNGIEGQRISNNDKTLQRWKECFEDFLYTTPDSAKTAQSMQEDRKQKLYILKEEIAGSYKNCRKEDRMTICD